MSPAAKPLVSVIIIAKNHVRALPLAIIAASDQLSRGEISYEIIVVDAKSADATPVIGKRLSQLLPAVRYFPVEKGGGEGIAARHALASARGHWLIFFPPTGSVAIVEFQKVLPYLLNGYDVALGSRALPRSVVRPQLQILENFFRVLHNAAVRFAAAPGIRDTESGFLCISKTAAEKLSPELKETGAGWAVELAALARHHGFRVKEFPVFWENVQPFDYRRYAETLKGAFRIKTGMLRGMYKKPAPRISENRPTKINL